MPCNIPTGQQREHKKTQMEHFEDKKKPPARPFVQNWHPQWLEHPPNKTSHMKRRPVSNLTNLMLILLVGWALIGEGFTLLVRPLKLYNESP